MTSAQEPPAEDLSGSASPDEAASLAEPSSVREVQDSNALATNQVRAGSQVIRFRGLYAGLLLATLLVQIIAADLVFVIYGYANGWQIPAGAMQAWLAAVVVQIVTLVLAVTRYLFSPEAVPAASQEPNRDLSEPWQLMTFWRRRPRT